MSDNPKFDTFTREEVGNIIEGLLIKLSTDLKGSAKTNYSIAKDSALNAITGPEKDKVKEEGYARMYKAIGDNLMSVSDDFSAKRWDYADNLEDFLHPDYIEAKQNEQSKV